MHPADPAAALARLLDGNLRFAAGRPEAAAASADRIALAHAQRPFAAILGCSDSRVPVETVFDQGPGELFVIRLAGNIVTTEGLGSIEYAVEVLGSSLVAVLGHSNCGAVRAAMSLVESGTVFPGHIQLLAEAIAPIAADTRTADDAWWPAAVACNTRAARLALLRRSPLLRVAATRGKLRVAAMLYDLQSGVVELLD
ncbi:MAG TPA: carbonic anhydrase [Candidatus Acidoferrum sp.]|jgi:carbonic anhydrase|nr:carbonic anhydrase [Candidatus Acidoferrum sp.]